jgi:hypothetical protein
VPIIPIPDCGKGVNKDLLAAELDLGTWSDSLNFRYSNGFAEKVGGIAAVFNTPSVTPYYLDLYPISTTRYLIEAGLTSVYADNGTTATDITRIREAVAISGTIPLVSNVVTVTTVSAHGLTTGDTVTVTLPNRPLMEAAGVAITVTSATTFTYPKVTANDTALVGSYKVVTSSGGSAFTGAVADRWSGGALNGTLILNNPVDGLYYWNGNTALRLSRLYSSVASAVPIGYQSDVARIFKEYVVQLATTESGVKYPYRVAWSTSAEPGSIPTSFIASATNDAGLIDLAETPGYLVDCLPLGDVNIIYKQDARYAMQWIGGDFVFRFSRLPGTDGLLTRGCVASTPVGHVMLTTGKDVKVHTGGEAKSLAGGRIRSFLSTDMDSTNATRSFVVVNPTKSEVWVCYPSTGQSSCDKAVIWNWENDTWAIRSLSGVTYGVAGVVPTAIAADSQLLLSTTTPRIGLVESGSTDFGSSITGTLERIGMHFDQRSTSKTLRRSRWNFDGTAGQTISIQHGSAKTADAVPTYSTAGTYTIGTTDFVGNRSTGGKYSAVKLTTTTHPLKLRSGDLDVTFEGQR